MPIATIRAIGDGLYHIHVLEGRTDPGYGQGGGFHPDQGLPGGGHISNRPPGSWGGHPDQGLPGGGGHPSQGLPGGGHIDNSLPGAPGHPDNRPPSQPPQVAPGETIVMVRSGDGKWHYAVIAPGSPPPRPVPVPPPNRPDQGLPPHPSQGLPGGPPPMPGQGLPPTAAPKPAE